MFQVILVGLLLSGFAYACPEHEHVHTRRAQVPAPITPPTRELVWSDFNVIHTTDSHGWLLGHQKPSAPEPNYSADFGEFASFVAHMKEIALEKDVDLLLVDSGDLHDGTGLSDGFPPGGVDAHASNQFIKELPYDVLSIGNHELYIYANTFDMYTNFAPHWNGRYLSSNVNITVADPNNPNSSISVPVGSRFAKFETRKGRKITSLGVLYDFTDNDVNTTVQTVADMVKEQWFADAIKDEPDVFVLVGHMPVRQDNWPLVYDAVRAVHPTTPILIFGGHSHIRDCLQFDGRSMSLESGRYMETVGWMSVDLDSKDAEDNLTFTRRYLDPNRITYEFHTGRSNETFDTANGEQITAGMNQLAQDFDLSFLYGTAPQDYFLTRAPFPSNDSLLSLFIAQAAPVALAINNTRANIPNIMIVNSGEQRFDLYSGPFTKNDQLTASPFTDSFLFIPNITLEVASAVLPALNGQGAQERRAMGGRGEKFPGRSEAEVKYLKWLQVMGEMEGAMERRSAENLTLGYVTSDTCPGAGDDTVHAPLPFFSTPDFISSNTPNVTSSTPIDLVFINFIESQLLGILNTVQSTKKYTSADVQSYSPILANAVLGLYAQEAWN